VAFNFSGDKAEESTQKYDWMKNGVFKSKATISTGGNHKKMYGYLTLIRKGYLCMARGVESTTPIFISPPCIQDAPKCIYIIIKTFPIISQNPRGRIYKTPSVGDLQS